MRVAVCVGLVLAACGGGAQRIPADAPEVAGTPPALAPSSPALAPSSPAQAPLEALTWSALRAAGAEAFDPAELRGRWVLAQAITTTCVPCEAQLTEVQAIAKRFELTWLLLLLDAHPERAAPRFAETWALDATLLLAPPEARGGTLPWGRVDALPEYWLIDPAGQVRGRFSGFLPVTQVEVLLGR